MIIKTTSLSSSVKIGKSQGAARAVRVRLRTNYGDVKMVYCYFLKLMVKLKSKMGLMAEWDVR